MKVCSDKYLMELYAKGVHEGIKIGCGGVTAAFDIILEQGVGVILTSDARSISEQMRMRAALTMDTDAIAAEAMKRIQAEDETA